MRRIFTAVTILIGLMTACSAADNTYFMSGSAYGPEQYCEFGGGIPQRYVDICEKIAPQSRQARYARQDKAQRWVRIEADNGAVYAIDLGNVGIIPSGGAVYATVCAVDHNRCDVMNRRAIWFDCNGHYSDMTNPSLNTHWQIAAPLSTIGRAANLACERAKSLPKGNQSGYK